jgi:hypothetical protein
MHSFELVHILVKFLVLVSALMYHLQGEKYASFLKSQIGI